MTAEAGHNNSQVLNEEALRAALECSWSIETSSRWMSNRPELGQCSVTALVVLELYGGTIEKTYVNGQAHFYNRIGGRRYDFTAAQFDKKPEYLDLTSDREEALADTSWEQLRALMSQVRAIIGPKLRANQSR